MLSPFAPAYLAGEARARAFLPEHFGDRAARRAAVQRAAAHGVAPGVVAALREQDRDLPPGAARARNLEALAATGTAAVVTGQQVGLFLGPLYTIYKAATAVVVARALEQETGGRCVPIFWLQTEDHDFAEVDHCDLPRPGAAPLRLQLAADPAAARRSLGDRVLGPDVVDLLAALAAALGEAPHAAEVVALYARHYRPGRAPGRAFAGVLAELFADEGLVLFDPRHPAIAPLAAPLHRSALLRHDEIAAALAARSGALAAAGFATQIEPRPEASLGFVTAEGVSGARYRLTRAGTGWTLPGGRALSTDEALTLLEREPGRFSTSALLRPILQDRLLPTAAYVGGPGEIGYFAQLGPLYELFAVRMPLIVPRARFRLLDEKTRALLGKLGLRAADAEAPRAELLRRLSPIPPIESIEVDERLRAAVQPHLEAIAALDPSLRDPVAKVRASIERLSIRLQTRVARACLERDRVAAERVDRLQGLLCPGGVPQERVFSLPWFAAGHGARALVERVLAAVVPFAPEPKDLEP